ncbi:hypothetical protein BDR04DRAFT_36436 [Suillus decipiens]|nr:hypothetical protein BDR04DRAFT_36436 [Suillus decipiens]
MLLEAHFPHFRPQIVAHSVLASRILFNLHESMEDPLLLIDQSANSMGLLSCPHEFNARPGEAVQPDEAQSC